MKLVGVNVDWMQLFVIIDNAGTKINVDLNVKNELTEVDGIKDLFGVLVIVNVNVIDPVMSVNIYFTKIVNAEINYSIN